MQLKYFVPTSNLATHITRQIVTIFQAATGLADGTLKVNRERSGMKKLMKMLLEDNSIGRNFVFNKGISPLKA